MKWNEVTLYSRLGAIIVFIGVLPILTFYLGMQYQKVVDTQNQNLIIFDGKTPDKTENQVYECDGDAFICPDGSSVGRTGPACEFAACPVINATSARLTTYLGGSATALNVTVSPQEVVSDSRCPAEVACIWAGTVEVRTILSTAVSHGEHSLTLFEPQVFGDYTVTLVEVSPYKTLEEIPDSSYRFTFDIIKN